MASGAKGHRFESCIARSRSPRDHNGLGGFLLPGDLLRTRERGNGCSTPRIYKLASEGARLLNFNVEAQCTPSRSAMMTGRFSIRSGTHSVPIGGGFDGLTQWEVTIAELLSGVGYATGHFGKWHLGTVQGRLPSESSPGQHRPALNEAARSRVAIRVVGPGSFSASLQQRAERRSRFARSGAEKQAPHGQPLRATRPEGLWHLGRC